MEWLSSNNKEFQEKYKQVFLYFIKSNIHMHGILRILFIRSYRFLKIKRINFKYVNNDQFINLLHLNTFIFIVITYMSL